MILDNVEYIILMNQTYVDALPGNIYIRDTKTKERIVKSLNRRYLNHNLDTATLFPL